VGRAVSEEERGDWRYISPIDENWIDSSS